MKKNILILSLIALSFSAFAEKQEARLLRFPSVGGDKIVFTYAGDLYVTSIDGGQAQRLTANIGFESFSRISPDGKTIAFTGQYDGNTEVYSMPIEGGIPKRLTYSATLDRDNIGDRMGPNNIVMCWTPDGKQIVYRSRWYAYSGMKGKLYKVSANGGVPEQIPVSEGGFCSYSPDGKQFAFNRMFREFRTWKYYKGGQADEIWINKVGTNSLEKITDNPNQDIFPMWIGDEIFYMSDRDRTMNLFCYNTKTKQTEKVTFFTEYDCKFPSFSQQYVVFENGGFIYRFDVKSRKCEKLTIYLDNDGGYGRSEVKSVRPSAFTLSPDGKRVIVTARGDLFSVPAEQGVVFNLTESPQAHEKDAAWSPDGKKIAYFSDADGEYQLYTASSDFKTIEKRTSFKNGYPTSIKWTPDSKHILFTTEKNNLMILDDATGEIKELLKGEYGGIGGINFSPDSKWIAYTTAAKNNHSVIYIMSLNGGKSYAVTRPWVDSSSPLFSEDGKYLFFTSAVDFTSQNSRMEWNVMLAMNQQIFVLPLAKGTPDPTALSSDEYLPSAEASAKKGNAPDTDAPKGKGGKNVQGAPTPEKSSVPDVKIDFDGIEFRANDLPIGAGFFSLLYAPEGKLYYRGGGPRGGAPAGRGGASVQILDLKTMTSKEAPFKGNLMSISSKGKALVSEGGNYKVIDINTGRGSEKSLPMADLQITVDHAAEWSQIYDESWRITRDFFYVRNMHGRDWPKVHDKYAQMLPYVQHRHDLTYLIGEMLGELNVGHAYITSGEAPEAPRVKVGLLGGQFSKADNGAFRIEKVFKGAEWDQRLRSPLAEPGVNAKVGEFVTKINGVDASKYSDIYQALVGKAGKMVSLTIAADKKGRDARTVYVKPIADETHLAYCEWVEENIKKVEKLSGGEVGYIHIPDMGAEGQEMFARLFYSQLDKKALIIDDRMNGGGNISPMIMERLGRVPYRMSMYYNGRTQNVPNESHYGPKVVLIDKYSMSDGDLFPYSFKKMKLGTIIGVRSWGGIVGISGSKPFVDGQDMRTPFFTSYSVDTGEWIVEGYGVDPDIVVDNNPFDEFKGIDAQLEKAVKVAMEQLKDYPALPGIPTDPIR